MSILSSNIRGLGNPRTVQALHDLVKNKVFKLVFVLETRLEIVVADQVRYKLGFNSGFHVSR